MANTKLTGRPLEAFEPSAEQRLEEKLREVLKGLGDSWLYESEIIKACGTASHLFARVRPRFTDFYVNIPGKNPRRAWAGTKAFAQKLAERLK